MALYLGFDSSTQSLTAIVIEVGEDDERRVVFERSLRFDDEFPEYGTHNGVLPRDEPLVAHSSPQLWAEALDRMMGILADDPSVDLGELRAISGSGQQHGSVYLAAGAGEVLARLDPARPLVEQIRDLFARPSSPIWMDSSTREQCDAITRAVGGWDALTRRTGSRAFERFTGPQIRKFYEQDPDAFGRTERVHLVSSYAASLLAGRHAPIDPGDGAGMNLMDLAGKRWAPAALRATAPGLEEKLPELVPSETVIGPLARYWVDRYGFPGDVNVVTWSGDNPCSLIGVGLVSPGRIAVSLGTSDTLFGFMPVPHVDPTGAGHVFGSPTGDYMSLICFQNGSLARDAVRRAHRLDWEGFSAALRETPPGNHGRVLLPWFEPEITPPVHEARVWRYGLEESDASGNVRAVVEAQMMATWLHSRWMRVDVDTIYATGGAARNREILQVMADVHGAGVYRFSVGNSACLGAALRALHADRLSSGRPLSWDEVISGFVQPLADSRIDPTAEHVAVYDELKKAYAACEAHALRGERDPAPLLAEFRKRHG